jgi:hypothetical protein
MKIPTSLANFVRTAFIAAGALAVAISAQAGLQIPYAVDADTLHLWHLQDASGLYATDAVATSSITLTNYGEPSPGTGPYTNTSLGSASGVTYPGLGICDTSTTKQHLLYGGQFPDVSQFRNATSGAFTFEALVKLNTAFSTADAEVLCGDNTDAASARGWQWRIYQNVMEWNLLAGSTSDNDFKLTLPTKGPDAIVTGVWYHMAITYTGSTPTNSDTPNLITMYWTPLDPSRTYADTLGQVTATRPLDGGSGLATPWLGIGGSARNIPSNPGNNEGLIGSIEEVRVSDIARGSNQMAFVSGGAFPPKITANPPTNNLVAYGGPLILNTIVSGTPPVSFTWLEFSNTVPNQTNTVPNQTDSTLDIPNATFAAAGSYFLIASNAYGSATSTVAQVTIGAAATELFSTGIDSNGLYSAGDIVDPHYELIQSADVNYLGPNTMIYEWNYPIEFAPGGGTYSPTNGLSMWIGDEGNPGGSLYTSPVGTYTYRTTFLLDQAIPSTVTLQANLWCAGSITSILLNGQSTGISLAPGGTLYICSFTYGPSNMQMVVNGTTTYQGPLLTTAGFIPGVNTLDFVESISSGASSIRVDQPYAVGQALAPGLPSILVQPANQTVRDASLTGPGSLAEFSVVALGRPVLSYQWWADGSALSGATNRVLDFYNPTAGGQGTDFSVVVANSSGSVTSRVAMLTIVPTNQPPVCPTLNVIAFSGATIQISDLLVLVDADPDHDPLTFYYADPASTNGVANSTNNVTTTATTLVYTAPVSGYVGPDEFTYTVADSLSASAVGYVELQNLAAPISQTVPPGVAVSFNVGLTNPPAGFTFQWQLNGANLPAATNSQLVISNAQTANAGSYVLVVTDPYGVASSSPAATLTVQAYAPYPLPNTLVIDSSEQAGFPATNAVDGSLSTFWVSYGTASGQGPSVSNPEWLFVIFPREVALSEFLVYPRSGYAPGDVQMIVNSALLPGTPPNGTETIGIPTNGTSIYTGTMANSATPLDVVLSQPVYATNAQLYITSAYDPTYPTSPRNAQVAELVFNERAMPGTFGDWELGAFTSAQINNSAISSPFADPDHDGVLNLQEFAVGGNPLVADATNAAMSAVFLAGNQVAVQYQARNQMGDVSLQFQTSPDLINWTNVTPVVINQLTNLGTISINRAVFPHQTPMLFYRLDYGLTNVLRY